MSVDTVPAISPQLNGVNVDCLVQIVDEAERTPSMATNSMLGVALDRHVVIETSEDDVELMCSRCPVMCTIKSVGGSAIALVNNRNECIQKD